MLVPQCTPIRPRGVPPSSLTHGATNIRARSHGEGRGVILTCDIHKQGSHCQVAGRVHIADTVYIFKRS
jgi:hypothetical protein